MTGFLDLPAELRNNIYAFVFENINKSPKRPFILIRPDLTTFRNLLLANRQIHNETKSIFEPSRMTFYASNIPMMYKWMRTARKFPAIANASFVLRVVLEYGSTENLQTFLAAQDGWVVSWPVDPRTRRLRTLFGPAPPPLPEWFSKREAAGEGQGEILRYPSFGETLVLKAYVGATEGDVMVLTGRLGALNFDEFWSL